MFTNHKTSLLNLLLIGIILSITSCTSENRQIETHDVEIPITFVPNQNDTVTLQDAFAYCDLNDFSKDLVLLVNLAPHSGNYRLFAVNLLTQDTLLKGLIAHGHCKGTEGRFAHFSNEIGSNCSSLGRYRIGGNYVGNYGNSFKLIGLDSSNSNAASRFVVLHGHACIPNQEQEDDICPSEGCPTVSPEVLEQLDPILKKAEKPILLWIYN